MNGLTEEELKRYNRHIILKDIGLPGQMKIKAGRVLVIGAGGLGSPVLMYLAAAGVGTIGVADGDVIDISNLQRQVIHSTRGIGSSKAESAKRRMLEINPNVNVVLYNEFLDEESIAGIAAGYDFIVDGTDNFAAKLLINDTCTALGKPFSHGAIFEFEGHTFTHTPGSACYRCIFGAAPPPEVMPAKAGAGLFGAIAGMLGTIQAAEALKYLTGMGTLLTDSLLRFDARTMDFIKLKVRKDPECPACGGVSRQ